MPAGIEAVPAGIGAVPAGTGAVPAGTEAVPAGTEAAPAGTEAVPAGTEVVHTGARAEEHTEVGAEVRAESLLLFHKKNRTKRYLQDENRSWDKILPY